MSDHLHFWYAPGACSLAPHIILHELKLSYQPVCLTIAKGIPPELFQINPKGRVPILIINEDAVTEVPAILTALTQLDNADRKLLGNTPLEIVRSYEWMNWLSGTMHGQAYGGLFRPARFIEDEDQLDAIRTKARKTIQECNQFVEDKLRGPYAVGDGFTVVDAYLYVFWRWGCQQGFDMNSGYPKYAALVEQLLKRDAVKKTLKVEDIEIYRPSC